MTDIPPSRLGGEADSNTWHFSRIQEAGPLPNPTGHTFPLLTHDSDGCWRVVGTGFYINDEGLFVTAHHVIEDVLEGDTQILPLIILHLRSDSGLFGPSEFLLRPIRQCWLGNPEDVALGIAAAATNSTTGEVLKNWTWTLSWSEPRIGDTVLTYAFPNHVVFEEGRRIRFAPDAYIGKVRVVGNFRDSIRMPFPFLQVDFRIHGAASGGPILSGSRVVGVNCSEYVNIDLPPGPGYGTQSKCLANSFLDNVILPSERVARLVTFDELVRVGCIYVDNYVARDSSNPLCGRLIQLNLAATAPAPAITLAIYA